MKDSLPDIFQKHLQHFRPGSRVKENRERRDRRWEAIKEGWDVSGPRWRIGWGGLDEPEAEDATLSNRRH